MGIIYVFLSEPLSPYWSMSLDIGHACDDTCLLMECFLRHLCHHRRVLYALTETTTGQKYHQWQGVGSGDWHITMQTAPHEKNIYLLPKATPSYGKTESINSDSPIQVRYKQSFLWYRKKTH